MSACCDSRARRERKREKEKERETLRKKNSPPLFLWTLCLSVDDQTKRRFQKRWKKKEKRRKFLFLLSPAASCTSLLRVDSLRSFSSSSISSSDSYWNQWIMNTQTLYFKWLWCARAARRRRKRQRKFRNLIVSLSPPHFDETTRRWEKKNHHHLI